MINDHPWPKTGLPERTVPNGQFGVPDPLKTMRTGQCKGYGFRIP